MVRMNVGCGVSKMVRMIYCLVNGNVWKLDSAIVRSPFIAVNCCIWEHVSLYYRQKGCRIPTLYHFHVSIGKGV